MNRRSSTSADQCSSCRRLLLAPRYVRGSCHRSPPQSFPAYGGNRFFRDLSIPAPHSGVCILWYMCALSEDKLKCSSYLPPVRCRLSFFCHVYMGSLAWELLKSPDSASSLAVGMAGKQMGYLVSFTWVPGTQTQVLMPVPQTLCPLSSLPRPILFICLKNIYLTMRVHFLFPSWRLWGLN